MPRITSRALLWYLPALVGCASALVLAAGFALGVRGPSSDSPDAARPRNLSSGTVPKTSGRKLLLVLGDSLARGTGDQTGRGFAQDVLDTLRGRGPAEVANLAVNGAESSDVLELVSRPNVRALAASADVILLSAGGNDLSHAAPRGGEKPAVALERVSAARRRFAANLRSLLGALRAANPSAPILVLGLYDPFNDSSPRGQLGASVILGWNAVLQETALSTAGVQMVPTFDLFQGRPDRLSVDRFHPSRAGYQAIAQRIGQILPGGS